MTKNKQGHDRGNGEALNTYNAADFTNTANAQTESGALLVAAPDKTETSTGQAPDFEASIRIALACRMPPAGARIFRFLATHRKATTGQIAHACEVGNISDAVIKIQPVLSTFGLAIRNHPPAKKRQNRWGTYSQAHEWELVNCDEAE